MLSSVCETERRTGGPERKIEPESAQTIADSSRTIALRNGNGATLIRLDNSRFEGRANSCPLSTEQGGNPGAGSGAKCFGFKTQGRFAKRISIQGRIFGILARFEGERLSRKRAASRNPTWFDHAQDSQDSGRRFVLRNGFRAELRNHSEPRATKKVPGER